MDWGQKSDRKHVTFDIPRLEKQDEAPRSITSTQRLTFAIAIVRSKKRLHFVTALYLLDGFKDVGGPWWIVQEEISRFAALHVCSLQGGTNRAGLVNLWRQIDIVLSINSSNTILREKIKVMAAEFESLMDRMSANSCENSKIELEKYSRNYPFDDFVAWFSLWAEDLLRNLKRQESLPATVPPSNCVLIKVAESNAVADETPKIVSQNSIANMGKCETSLISGDGGQRAGCVRGSKFLLKDVDGHNLQTNCESLDSSCSDVDDYSDNGIYRSPPVNNRGTPSSVMHTRALKLISSRNGNYNNCSTTASEYSKISRELFGFHRHRKVIDKPQLIDFSDIDIDSDQRYDDAAHQPPRSSNMLS